MKIHLLDKFDNFLRWWSDGLTLIVPQRWRERQQRIKEYLVVRRDNDQIVIEHCQPETNNSTTRHVVSINDSTDHKRARERLKNSPRLKMLPVILRLTPDSVLVKRVRYPATVRDDLRHIIAFDIDRQTPFARDDVYFDYSEISGPETDKHIEIDLVVVPKRVTEASASVLDSIGLRLSIIDITDRTFFDRQINLLPNPEIWRNGHRPYRTRLALFIVWLTIIVLIPGKQLLDTSNTIERLEADEGVARTAVRGLNELRDQHTRLVGKFNFFRQIDTEHSRTIELLHEITLLLSDNTWIRRFDLKNGTLTLQGESDNASDIPGILEGSELFSSPRFSSPVTRNNATGKDRFQIVVAVRPESSS